MLYFAYGSNMSTLRLKARIPSVRTVGQGCLRGYRLTFDKVSIRDGSGKCDARFTGGVSDTVFGVLFDLSETDFIKLDEIEGKGQGYERKSLFIKPEEEGFVAAETYLGTIADAQLKPMHWYKEHVLWGANEHHLPKEYIEHIEGIEAIIDMDTERVARERSIYR